MGKRSRERGPAKIVIVLPTKPRMCLKCLEKFPSIGPGNRICSKCGEANATVRGPVVGRKTIEGRGFRHGVSVGALHSH